MEKRLSEKFSGWTCGLPEDSLQIKGRTITALHEGLHLKAYTNREHPEMLGMLYRIDGPDRSMINDCVDCYDKIDFVGKTCLDMGANVGGFARLALMRGAKHVVCYEPLPENAKMLRLNLSPFPAECYTVVEAACWTEDGATDFILPNSANATCSAHLGVAGGRHGGTKLTVLTVNMATEYASSRPEVIKMDIEGAEYEVLRIPPPDSVTDFVIEWHVMSKRRREVYDTVYRPILESWPVAFKREWTIFGGASGGMEIHYRRMSGASWPVLTKEQVQ